MITSVVSNPRIAVSTCLRYRVRSWTASKERDTSRYMLTSDEGLIDRLCSRRDKQRIAMPAKNDRRAAGSAPRVSCFLDQQINKPN